MSSNSNCPKCHEQSMKKEESKRKREQDKKQPEIERATTKASKLAKTAHKQLAAISKLCKDFPDNDGIRNFGKESLSAVNIETGKMEVEMQSCPLDMASNEIDKINKRIDGIKDTMRKITSEEMGTLHSKLLVTSTLLDDVLTFCKNET